MWHLALQTAVVILAIIGTLIALLIGALLFSLVVAAFGSWAEHRKEEREWQAEQEKKQEKTEALVTAARVESMTRCRGTWAGVIGKAQYPCELRKNHPGACGVRRAS